jgi:endonuclease G
MYIISGGYGVSGYIGAGQVALPTSTWKVIIVLPSGSNDVGRVNASTRTIAVVMPNQNNINSDWRTYRVSVDAVESLTGFDFFSNVPADIQAIIESRVDNQRVYDWEMTLDEYSRGETDYERQAESGVQ